MSAPKRRAPRLRRGETAESPSYLARVEKHKAYRASLERASEAPPPEAPPLVPPVPPGVVPPTPHERPVLVPPPVVREPLAPLDLSGPDAAVDALSAQCLRFHADVAEMRASEYYDTAALAKLEKALADSLERYARASGALRAVEEHRLTKTLTFRRHVERVLRALEDYPEARLAVATALDSANE